jgi:hypothetical protein
MQRILLSFLSILFIQSAFAQLSVFDETADAVNWVVDNVGLVLQGWSQSGFARTRTPLKVSLA